MAQIENRTVAAQTFLSGLRALPNFEDLKQKQYDQLLTLIRSKVILFEHEFNPGETVRRYLGPGSSVRIEASFNGSGDHRKRMQCF